MSNLEQQLGDILATAETKGDMMKVEEKPAEEVKENNEESGVEQAADESQPKEETAESIEEGGEEEAPSDELDEEFKNLDPEVREALKKADAETRKAQANAFKKMRAAFDRKQTELGQEKKLAETAKQIFSKHGIDPNLGLTQVEKLIRFERELEKDPKNVINLLKQKFNLQDEKVSGSDELDESLLTDEEKILYKQNKEIKKELEDFKRKQQEELRRREDEDTAKAKADIEAFKNQKNEDGSLKNPYFDDLIDDIGRLVDLYPNDSIDKLYNRALRLNDDIYQKSLEDIKKQEREKVLKEKQAQVEKAKTINAQTAKSSPKNAAKPTLDDILFDILNSSNA